MGHPVEVDDIKAYSDEQQAEMIADRFAEVSSEYEPLDRQKIKFPPFNPTGISSFTESEVLNVLQNMNINKLTRNTDIPAKMLKIFARKIYKPLTLLINSAVKKGIWPDFLKLEIALACPLTAISHSY